MKKDIKVIGLTGTLASGQTKVKEIFDELKIDHGYVSLSDIIKDALEKEELIKNRQNMLEIGNKFRKEFGTGYWAIQSLKILEDFTKDIILVDSIKNPGEIKVLKEKFGDNFYLIGLDGPLKIRFGKEKGKGNAKEISLDEFLEMDLKNKGVNNEKFSLKVESCLASADYLIWNKGRDLLSPEENERFKANVKDFYELFILKQTRRPTFEEVFMNEAYNWRSRSTCLRRKVGAVLTKDSKTVATGYNGATKKLESCTEKGFCYRQQNHIPSGQQLEKCHAIHAEENVLLQTANMGNSSDGTTIYVTNHPCFTCSKHLVQAGVKKIVYQESYPDILAEKCFEEAEKIHETELKRSEGVVYKNFTKIFVRE